MSFTSGPFTLHAQQVLVEDRAYCPKNTLKSYNNRVKEFIQFCEDKYSSESHAQNASTVTEEKLFGFLHYQSRRPLRPWSKKSSYKKRQEGAALLMKVMMEIPAHKMAMVVYLMKQSMIII